ncbi:MAG: hypothetical protein DKT66_24705 [Candidatus Melainabacteria bacterium]|nr:MAG: hypothetical protein DKT66_24705 [Candidatus Melainabacteria bacterium]
MHDISGLSGWKTAESGSLRASGAAGLEKHNLDFPWRLIYFWRLFYHRIYLNQPGLAAKFPEHVAVWRCEMLKIWLTNLGVSCKFTIIKMEFEMTENHTDKGVRPDGVVSDKVKNLDLGIAIMHLFSRCN